MGKKWYVVFKGTTPGIYNDWEVAQVQVHGVEGNCYRGYSSKDKAMKAWLKFCEQNIGGEYDGAQDVSVQVEEKGVHVQAEDNIVNVLLNDGIVHVHPQKHVEPAIQEAIPLGFTTLFGEGGSTGPNDAHGEGSSSMPPLHHLNLNIYPHIVTPKPELGLPPMLPGAPLMGTLGSINNVVEDVPKDKVLLQFSMVGWMEQASTALEIPTPTYRVYDMHEILGDVYFPVHASLRFLHLANSVPFISKFALSEDLAREDVATEMLDHLCSMYHLQIVDFNHHNVVKTKDHIRFLSAENVDIVHENTRLQTDLSKLSLRH